MKLIPRNDWILVEPTKLDKSAGGIFLPDNIQERARTITGKVLAVGPGAMEDGKRVPIADVKVGDTIVFGRFAGHEHEDGQQKLKMISEAEVLAVVKE